MKTMEIQITEQFSEVYNLSIDIDVIINGQKFNIYGHINLDTYKAELHIVDMETHTLMTKDMREVELSEWCLRHGHDYRELKHYIINNIELPKNDSHDHESNSLSPNNISCIRKELLEDRPYIRYKTSVLEQMLMSGNVPSEILIEKELNLREDRLVYAVEKYLHTSEPKIFETDKELARWLRSRGVDENNELSDEYIINEAISIGEIKQVKRKDIANPNTRN